MKSAKVLLTLLILLVIGYAAADLLYFSKYQAEFKSLERDRIITSNKLATAKIISENLNHVRDMVYQNMEFGNKKDSLGPDLAFFGFLTESANDLKMRIVSVTPEHQETKGRVTTYGYAVEMEGDFFSFGEFCSKLENNRRILALTDFELSPLAKEGEALASTARRGLRIKLHLNAYRVRK